jgi:predicted nucleic acid-binding protein
MNGFLIDTNVISELRKGPRANPNVRDWFDREENDRMFLSVLVLGEIRRGIEIIRKRDTKAAVALERWLANIIGSKADQILPVDATVADMWGQLDTRGRLPVVDGLLAATALVHDLTLVTRNVKDVARTGVEVVNPFEPRAIPVRVSRP